MNLNPSKTKLMHPLMPSISISVQYFQNVVPIFCDGYLILGKILISVNIYFIIFGATTFIVRHRHGAEQCTSCHQSIKILKIIFS